MKQLILTAHQPSYLPWLGLFHKIAISDEYIYLDTVQYEKNSFINRNKIVAGNDVILLTVPVNHKNHLSKTIEQLTINNNIDWRKKHWNSLYFNYKSSPYFYKYADFFEDTYKRDWAYLSELAFYMLKWFLDELGIDTSVKKASECNFEGRKSDLILDMSLKSNADIYVFGEMGKEYVNEAKFNEYYVTPFFQKYNHPIYKQRSEEFKPYMSIVDLLFNEGANSLDILMNDNINKNKILMLRER